MEKQKYITGGKTGSSDVHAQVEKARLSTEKLEREFQGLQEGMKELGERVTELASRVESSHREPATTNDTTNSDLETLDCSQVQGSGGSMIKALYLVPFYYIPSSPLVARVSSFGGQLPLFGVSCEYLLQWVWLGCGQY